MAKKKSAIGYESVMRVVTSPLPRPVQYALGSRFRFFFAMICIAFAMFFGIINLGWINGRPSVSVDRQKLQNLKQKAISKVQDFQQAHPATQQVNLQPLLQSKFLNNNGQAAQYPQQYNNGYPAPTQAASQPMVYPQQQYQPTPYQGNPYQANPYANQPQYGTSGNSNPYAAQPPNNSPSYNQYPSSPGYPNNGQPARGTVPQYSSPGYR